MIKASGFDYGGVIGAVGSNGTNFTKQVCEILRVSQEQYKAVYFGMNDKINLGEIDDWHEFWKLFLQKMGQPNKYDAVIALSDEADRLLDVADQDMLALVDALRRNGYKTGLLSNNPAENGRRMRRLGIDKHFDVFHISAETGLMKPSPEAFIHLAEAMGVQPSEMIFIDDAGKSLSAADEAGFIPILFTSYERLKQQLADAGVRGM